MPNTPSSSGALAVRAAQPLAREHMPTDFEISLDGYIGRSGLCQGHQKDEEGIPTDFGPSQSLHGFEATYQNIIDYIVRITARIWEERDVHYIADTYADSSHVYDDYGLQLGDKKIIADTTHTLNAFSDIQLIADDIVWAGNDEIGFHTSHRTLIRGTNDGDSKYGPATNRKVDVLVIANCVCLENEIFLEHVLYNNSSLITQLGLNLEDMAVQMARSPSPGWPRDESTWDSLRSATRPAIPLSASSPVAGFDIDTFTRETMNGIWNQTNRTVLERHYSTNFTFSGPTNRTLTGAKAYRTLIGQLQQCFPDLEHQVDEVYWMGNDRDGYLTSERWSAIGTHSGNGLYGEATGRVVQIWGITQHRVVNGLITREWMLFNELDLMIQIAAARIQGK